MLCLVFSDATERVVINETRVVRTCWNAGMAFLQYRTVRRKYLPLDDKKDERGRRSEAYREAEKNPEYQAELKEVHTRAAARLLDTCKANGGVFVKLGQYFGSMNHVLPDEYTKTLAALQDDANTMPLSHTKKVLEDELGKPFDELFDEFGEKPVGAASLAQVHKAKLKDGREVAIKIQYDGLPPQVEQDLGTIRFLARIWGYIDSDFEYDWMFPEFEQNLKLELDFRQEGRNGERVAEMFADRPHVYIPKVYWDHTTKRVLTMEYIDGVKVNNDEAMDRIGANRAEVAKMISTVFSDMIFYYGFVHCDPHPGNMFIRKVPLKEGGSPQTQLVVIDHGMYRRVSCASWANKVPAPNVPLWS